ncbi:MAG: phage Gp37/Gp68 family protein [Chloroflexota bacterium]|nr:phage Gp37/Gp68 family protein [Chloroflexota bacterium]
MADRTAIEWTDATFNPWWGCTRVSPACAHCYADTLARRYGHQLWDDGSPRRFFSEQHWAQPRRWNRQAERAERRLKVFCASMADVFEEHLELDPWRRRLWTLIEETPMLDWQLLTKRPENVAAMVPWRHRWPANVWIGTSIENARHTFRANILRELPASIRFISAEPLLGSLFLNGKPNRQPLDLDGIDWVIAGGESGPRFRPLNLEWVRELRDACLDASIPFFYKQQGGRTPRVGGRELDGRTWSEFPLRMPLGAAAGATAIAS